MRLNGIINGQVASYGTGFYYLFNDSLTDDDGNVNDGGSAQLCIVTNKHVIAGMDQVTFYFNVTNEDGSEREKEMLTLSLDSNTVIDHPEDNVDLCVILAYEIINLLREKNKKIHLYPVRKNIRLPENQVEQLGTIQNLLMIGYPNAIWDHENNLPIMRTGINATPLYENYLGEDSFAVDIATYKGSSGSPVFIYDKGAYIENGQAKFGQRIIFVGVIKQAHSRSQRHSENITTEEMLHIGIAIKAHKLDVFEDLIRAHIE
ncbi:S1 family peptidase [Jeotgalibacillus haloalkalitolerans]|uniref:S1 family peptidase n=1 Tax=Jeotgalibacillus haloalkalitolerans TaxID=3104292 RepID=UPI003F493F99